MSREAAAVTAGARAFDLGVAKKDCPYSDDRARYWRLGHGVRRRATARWASYPDRFRAEHAKAAPFLDAVAESSVPSRSQLLALRFYVFASDDPDSAWEWWQGVLREARRQYLVRKGEVA